MVRLACAWFSGMDCRRPYIHWSISRTSSWAKSLICTSWVVACKQCTDVKQRDLLLLVGRELQQRERALLQQWWMPSRKPAGRAEMVWQELVWSGNQQEHAACAPLLQRARASTK